MQPYSVLFIQVHQLDKVCFKLIFWFIKMTILLFMTLQSSVQKVTLYVNWISITPFDFEAFLVYKNGTYSELSTIL